MYTHTHTAQCMQDMYSINSHSCMQHAYQLFLQNNDEDGAMAIKASAVMYNGEQI